MPSGGKASQTRASTTALALSFLKTHCGCEQGCDSTAASSATVSYTASRTPSCASFDRTRDARNEREEIVRLRAFANFACAQREPDQPLN
jgi:hypothetical protein